MSGRIAGTEGHTAERTDEELIARFQQGDTAAFNVLVGRYKNPLMNFAFRYLGSTDEADDVVQETFIRVHRSRHSYKPVARFSTWLYTICANLAKNRIRQRKQWGPLSLLWPFRDDEEPQRDMPDPAASADRQAEQSLQRELIQDALDSLRPEYREVVVLFDIQDLSYEEICEITGVPMGTVKSRLNRARALLREKLAALKEEAE